MIKELTMPDDLERRFTYHPPTGDQSINLIRTAGMSLAKLIDEKVPYSREKSLALTHLEKAVMWANAAIARNE